MEKEKLYRGRFEDVGDRKLNSVRVFVSSTFSDTTDERNGLIERVYPQLRKYCLNKYNIQFQYSDMRWGIQSNASNTHSTVDMCIQELDSCSRLSMATNCVILLSHRYGSRLAPAHMPYRIFQLLQDSLSTNIEEKNFLSDMYQLDENYIEKKVFFKPSELNEQSSLLEDKLKLILRKAANSCYEQGKITEDERNEFFISVTAKEIYRALKNNTNRRHRIVCFFRDIVDIEQLDSKFREIENIDETNHLLNTIKSSLHQSLDSSNIYTYKVRWNDESNRKEYFSKFFHDFYLAIKSQIDFHMKIHQNSENDQFYNQILEHAIQCNLLTQRYFPRQTAIEQIKTYLMSTSNRPCVLIGESGTGKSSILAKLVSEIPTWYDKTNSLSVIIRFLGVTPSSSDIRRPLISIIEQISAIYHFDVPSNLEDVKQYLESIFMRIPKNEYLVVLIDSIDQLQSVDLKNLSEWLPTKFPSNNFKFIISTIPVIEIDRVSIDIHKKLRTIYDNDIIEIKIDTLDEDLAKKVIDYWLNQDQRCLTSIQHEWIENKFHVRYLLTPLFVALLYDQTLAWHSYDQTVDAEFLAIKRTTDAIGYLYNRLGLKHGQTLFRRSMYYLQLSGGLSELEIEDILSSDDEILQAVFLHYLPPFELFRLPSNLWIRIKNDMHKYLVEKDIDNVPCICFYHRSFQYYETMNIKQMIINNQEKELLEKYRLLYFSNQYKETFDMSYSLKLFNKYRLSTTIIPVHRCLTQQKSFKDKKTKQYNLRRLNQLLINLNRYDFAHQWTIFDFNFLSAYLLCGEYKISDFLFQMSIGAHDPEGELRFLLKQFEASLAILNQYPNNLSFELIYRLFPYLNELPTLTYNLIEQCLNQCPFQLITNNDRLKSSVKYSLMNISLLNVNMHFVFVLTNNYKLYIFSYNYYGLSMIHDLNMIDKKTQPNESFVSFICEYPYICCLTSNSSMIVVHAMRKEVNMQIPCKKLISFVGTEMILIIASSNDSIELWNCSTNMLISKYDCDNNIIQDCCLKKTLVQIVYKENSMISYLKLDENFQFNPIRILNENINDHTHNILIDVHCEFFYSMNSSLASLMIYDNDNSKKIINDIDFSSLPTFVTYLSHSNSIAWLTSTNLLIFHPLYEQNIFQPFYIKSSTNSIDYDIVHDHSSSPEFDGLSSYVACLNKSKSIIDIYQWKYDEQQKSHLCRQLIHVQLDISIDRLVFTAYWYDGVIMYCSDGDNLYKYNVTMLTYLDLSKVTYTSPIINQIPNLHSNRFLTIKDTDNSLKIYTLNENNNLHLNLSINSIINYYFTQSSSYILCIDEKTILSIYSLNSSKLLWTNNSFEKKKLQIHSTESSFILISLQTKQIFQIDISKSFELKSLIHLSIDCHLSIMSSNNQLYILSTDQKTLIEFNINNQHMEILPPIQMNSKIINHLYSISDHLVFHADDNQIYLRWKEDLSISQLEQASRLISNQHRLALLSTDNKTMIMYDLEKKLRGIIPIDDDAGPCQAMNLSDYKKQNDQYLFIICHDRFLRIYNVSNGKQLIKLFVHTDLYPFIGLLNNYLLLKVSNRLSILKIIDKKSLPNKSSNIKCPLFKKSMWMTCHDENCIWSNAVIT